jgi:type I restriction enzyme S subunit
MGQSPDGDSYNTTGVGVPLINGPVEFSKDSFGKTIRSKFTTQPTKFCKEGDLILCVRGSTTGRMNIAGFDACVGRGVAAIRAKHYQPWINHFISSKRDEIHDKGTGATFPNV